MAWIELGPGAGMNEVLRAVQLDDGVLLATVYQRRTHRPLANGDERVVTDDEVTRAVVFLAGARIETLQQHRSAPDSEPDAAPKKASPARVLTESGATSNRRRRG